MILAGDRALALLPVCRRQWPPSAPTLTMMLSEQCKKAGPQSELRFCVYCQTGPLFVIDISWTVVDSVVELPAALIVPPDDAIPLFTTRLSFASIVMVNVPLAGVLEEESTMLGFNALKPAASPS